MRQFIKGALRSCFILKLFIIILLSSSDIYGQIPPCDEIEPSRQAEHSDSTSVREKHIWTKFLTIEHWNNTFLDSLANKVFSGQQRPLRDLQISRIEDFAPYQGKKIQKIDIQNIPIFNVEHLHKHTKDIDSITKKEKKSIKRNIVREYLNEHHISTRPRVVEQSLFFKEGDILNANVLVENLRYLRSLPYLYNASFLIEESTDASDGVIVTVITQDLYPLAVAPLPINGFTGVRMKFLYANINGWGQGISASVQGTAHSDPAVTTAIGYDIYNFMGTFTDIKAGYSRLNTIGTTDTGNYEGGFYFSANRPLYSSHTRIAGGIDVEAKNSINVNSLNPSRYKDYKYSVFDIWGAYALGKRNLKNIDKDLAVNDISLQPMAVFSQAIGIRYYQQLFWKRPDQPQYQNDPMYNNHQFVAASYSFFKQNIYTTQYLLGFGRIEDIPLGYLISPTIGFDYQLGEKRIYVGGNAAWQFSIGEGYMSIQTGAGGFLNNDHVEDLVISLAGIGVSKLYEWNKKKFRGLIEADFMNCYNPNFYKPLNLNGGYGLSGLTSSPLNGYKRLDIKSGVEFYTLFSIAGFKVNTQLLAEFSQLGDSKDFILAQRLYAAAGARLLIRNENLVFNTIRMTAFGYINTPSGSTKASIDVTTAIDLRFRVSPIKPPAFVEYLNRTPIPWGSSPPLYQTK